MKAKKLILYISVAITMTINVVAHPCKSPYSYCANNPVRLTDPDGQDYLESISKKNRTITLSGTYYTTNEDATSAQKSVDFWNKQSGKFIYRVTNRNNKTDVTDFKVNFSLSVKEIGESTDDKQKRRLISSHVMEDPNKSGNGYSVTADNNIKREDNNGYTSQGKLITIKESKKDASTGAHEVGHTLGLDHFSSGLMTPGEPDAFRSDEIEERYIKMIIVNPLKGKITKEGGAPCGKGIIPRESDKIDLEIYKGTVIKNEQYNE
ncbi:MAG: hypothetical protein IK005_02525 [Paludibacteraceae bacterium]|nr:hypothetical protein [Paludibacteraceae bacterium]